MSKHRERSRGNSLNDILRDIDINQVVSLMSALGINRGNNKTSNAPNNNKSDKDKDAQDFAKLLSNPKFLDIVNGLSKKIKNKDMDEETKQEEIKNAFNQVNSLIKKNRA